MLRRVDAAKCRLLSARNRLVTANNPRKPAKREPLQQATVLGRTPIRKVGGFPLLTLRLSLKVGRIGRKDDSNPA